MRVEFLKLTARTTAVFCFTLLLSSFTVAQQALDPQDVPTQFRLDMETAARLRPQFVAQSIGASGRYAAARMVFERLVAQVQDSPAIRFDWQLRIVENSHLNAYSSPDGTVYVENGLAQLAGASTGLWAAILSHEIAHILRRDWARRYLFQRSLVNGGSATIVLGDPSLPSEGWTDPQKASQDMARFCRRLEIEADHDGLMLMARAGYHPDFVPALHHLLHARGPDSPAVSLYAMHPCWEERDRELSRAYTAASIEFARRWPEWYASPGGNPPVLVFAEEPKVKKTDTKAWEIQVPMHCQNLAGAVEVVLLSGSRLGRAADLNLAGDSYNHAFRQLTGCTSPHTTVTFTLPTSADRQTPAEAWTDVYVLDAWGSVLARTDIPKRPR